MLLFGLVGFIDSGKGTVGNILKDRFGFIQDSFAAPLKDCVSIIFGWPRHLLEGDTKESREFREKVDPWWTARFGFDVTPRLMLQKFGTEACRDGLNDTVWLDSFEARRNPALPTVITDVRFVNEIKLVQKLGGYIAWVRKPELPEWYNLALDNNLNWTKMIKSPMERQYPNIHRSEWDWIGQTVDFTIMNDGNIEDLNKKVDEFITLSYVEEHFRRGVI